MSAPIKDKLIQRILTERNIENAYRSTAADLTEYLHTQPSMRSLHEKLSLVGVVDPGNLISHLKIDEINHRTMHVIVDGGHISDIPKASCVADKLKDNPHPTREEIEAAFAACAKPGKGAS